MNKEGDARKDKEESPMRLKTFVDIPADKFLGTCLATGFLFLSIGLVETVKQLILSHSYPFLFSMFGWDILLLKAILLMPGALIERKYIRGRKEATWREAFVPSILGFDVVSMVCNFWCNNLRINSRRALDKR